MEKEEPIDIKFIIKFREKQRLKQELKELKDNPHPDAMVHSLQVSEILRKLKELK
jgi:hypothetical protein